MYNGSLIAIHEHSTTVLGLAELVLPDGVARRRRLLPRPRKQAPAMRLQCWYLHRGDDVSVAVALMYPSRLPGF